MKESTYNQHHQAINRVVDYINSHLNEELSLAALADLSCISEYHFHRIFSSVIGEPIGAYITRLRLETAAQMLSESATSVTEIAEECGYQSLYALSKAFKKHFGATPSQFRRNPQDYSRIHIAKTVPPLELSPSIEELPILHLAYVRIIGKYGDEQLFTEGWRALGEFMYRHNLLTPITRWMGISFDSPHITQAHKCRFYACATVPARIKPEGAIGNYTIPAGQFAVYTLRGSYSGLQNMYDNIYRQTDFELRDSVSFEEYLTNPDNTREEDLLTKIYIPIK